MNSLHSADDSLTHECQSVLQLQTFVLPSVSSNENTSAFHSPEIAHTGVQEAVLRDHQDVFQMCECNTSICASQQAKIDSDQ